MTYDHSGQPSPWHDANPGPRRPWQTPPGSILLLVVVAILGMLAGIVVQQSRCGIPFNLASLSNSKPTLQRAEMAFRNGDNGTAVRQFTQLADQNNPVAQYWLGHMTELGLGVPRDPAKAVELYKKAAAQDNIAAELRLGEIDLHGDVVAPDLAQAKSYLQKAAHRGNPRAAMLLGQMYRLGLGTAADPKKAYAWAEVASLEGSALARNERDASLHALNGDDQRAAIADATSILAEIKQETAQPQLPNSKSG
jgi:TPR repeat protein